MKAKLNGYSGVNYNDDDENDSKNCLTYIQLLFTLIYIYIKDIPEAFNM